MMIVVYHGTTHFLIWLCYAFLTYNAIAALEVKDNVSLPLLINASSSHSIFAEEASKLQCIISFASVIKWETVNNEITENITKTDLESNVSISNLVVYPLKNTDYFCVGINDYGNVSYKISVTVIDRSNPVQLIIKHKSSDRITIGWKSDQSDVTKFYSISYKLLNSLNLTYVNASFESTNYTINNLVPYSNYTINVNQVFEGGVIGQISSITVETDQSAPDAPEYLEVKKLSTSIIVEWKRPKVLNGVITKVLLIYMFNISSNLSNITKKEINDSSTYEIVGLLPNTLYKISIKYKTVVYGNAATIFAKTEVGEPQIAPEGFSIYNRTASTVYLKWQKVPLYLSGGDLTGYSLDFQPFKTSLFVNTSFSFLIENEIGTLVTDLNPFTNYSVTLKAITQQFKGPPAHLLFSTLEGVPSAPQNLEYSSEVNEDDKFTPKVIIKWYPPRFINGILTEYLISFWKIGICKKSLCKREMYFSKKNTENGTIDDAKSSRRHLILQKLDSYSQYKFEVQEKTGGGWGESSATLIPTKPGKATPPVGLTMTTSSHNSITLSWSPPEHVNGDILFYEVNLFSSNNELVKTIQHPVSDLLENSEEKTILDITQLKSETQYIVKVAANNEYTGSYSELKVSTQKTPSILDKPWMFALIGFLAIVLLAALIMIVILVSRRQNKYKNVRTDDIEIDMCIRTKPIMKDYLKEYCIQQHANSDHGFQQEYELLKSYPHNFTWEHSQMPYNQPKNRYSNIVAYDHSRVILSELNNDASTTYINASYIDGYKKPKAFIATQGPLPETVIDFWRMIWETESSIIVMLTNLVEDSRIKCEQYWPEGKGLQYKDIVVTVDSVREMTDYTVRMFTLQKFKCPELGTRQVRQYHFTTWPDHGVPSHPTSVLSFTRHVMSYMDSLPCAECVVHCSAGVGRTGTFIAIEIGLRQLEAENKVDVFGSVFAMRAQRNFMVQTELQYTFIYDALLDSVVCGNTEIAPADLPAKIRFLNEQDPETNASNFASEFKRLESGSAPGDSNQYTDAAHHENKQKNRYLNILPYDKNRVKLIPIAGSRQSDYINASVIDGFQQKNAFIAAQAPLENTVKDFWRMILEKKIQTIVMLTKLEEKGQEKCYLYWPQAGSVAYGSVSVELLNVKKDDDYLVTHELRLTNQETGRSWIITHFWFLGWPDYGSPESGSEIIQLIGSVQKSKKSTLESGPILVHCSGGVGRTGVLMAVMNSIERLKVKGVVDIFQTIRALRLQRTAMVQTVDQYMFCYQALKDYLDSFDLIAVAKC
ncbi:receptor-type tyrosine-protein phosphatase alpha isoform X2 [Hydra vulgaris]|uniref:Receptor-type tyrosine-protein phosphatase alpha isoform X2 n=1 Tax=Hydra vulgaris TaxID=6087 RepID=A0ABM4C7R1_HYDVU